MATVEIVDIKKSFGAIEVLHGVNIDIKDEEFVVLVGPSGCGKSTLLRMIAGLEDISGGEIRIGGKVVNEVQPMHRDIAMVFQSYALYPHMTVFENMAFSLKLRKLPEDEIRAQVNRAAEVLNLNEYLERSPKQLSGGQRQRVAMGRALVRDPRVFLFDEPLSNLDAKLRVQMRTEIKALQQNLKTTTVYVTHDQIEAMTMADRIVVMHDGIIEQTGSPLELYDFPVNLFVADFIGSPSMNFIKGTLSRTEESASVICDDASVLPLKSSVGGSDGQKVVYGIRPEHLNYGQGDYSLDATVDVVEPTGSEIEVFGKLAGHDFCAVYRERHALKRGDSIKLNINPENVHLFDADSGVRL